MSVGLLDWSEQELVSLDVKKARKILNMTLSSHSKGDINHLYEPRSNGGRGLNSVLDMFKNRMVNLSNHLQQVTNNPMLEIVKHREKDTIVRIGLTVKGEYSSGEEHGKNFIKNNIKQEYYNVWKEKVTHGFLQKKLSNDTSVYIESNKPMVSVKYHVLSRGRLFKGYARKRN